MTSSVSYWTELEETYEANIYYTKNDFITRLSPNVVAAVLDWLVRDTVIIHSLYLHVCSAPRLLFAY